MTIFTENINAFVDSALFTIVGLAFSAVGVFIYWKSYELRRKTREHEKDMQRRLYEVAILKELGERVGYSLDIRTIVDIITGSVHQFLEFSAVAYMVVEPEKVYFKIHLEESVSDEFIATMKKAMFDELQKLAKGRRLKKGEIDDIISGAIVVEDINEPLRSSLTIPLEVGGKVVGILMVGDTKLNRYTKSDHALIEKIMSQASEALTRLQGVVDTEKEKLNAMVASMSEGVIMTDTDYRVIVANPAARHAVGLSENKEPSIFDFIDHFEGKFDIRGKLEESVQLGKVLESDDVFLNERFYKLYVSSVKSGGEEDAEILGGVVILSDITHEKEVEQLREDFTSMMVHELRSPLDSIKKMSEMMQKITDIAKNKKKFVDYAELIGENSGSMLTLVNDILDVAKLEAGKFDMHPVPLSPKKVMHERVLFYQAAADDAKIKLGTEFDPALPETVPLDPLRVTQVLNNFISNSLKFTQKGGSIVLQAFVHKKKRNVVNEAKKAGIRWFVSSPTEELKRLEPAVVFSVTDSGAGIAESDLPHLFSKFKQLETQTKKIKKQGSGLGLVICKGILEAHKGIIGVASEEGKGSTFYFTLPI